MGRGYTTPFGLNRWVLLSWYCAVLGFAGYFVGGVDPLRRLLVKNGIGKDFSDSDLDQRKYIEGLVNVGFGSATALSWFAARWASHRSPRWAGVGSIFAYTAGVVLLFLGDVRPMHYAGIMLIGGSFSATFNAHVSIGALFSAKTELVFDCLGSAPDVTSIVPLLLLWATNYASEGANTPENVIQVYVAILLIMMVIHAMFLPSAHYSKLTTKKYSKRMENTPKRQHKVTQFVAKLTTIQRLERLFKTDEDEDCLLGDLTLIQQVVHPLFASCGLFFTFNLLRKYHVLSTFRYTVESYAEMNGQSKESAQWVIEALNISLALCWIPTTFCTRLFADKGVLPLTVFISFMGLITNVCMCIPSVTLQWVTVISFACWSSLFFSVLFYFLSQYFGMRHVANLQGSQMIIGGAISMTHSTIMDLLGNPFTEGSSAQSNWDILGMKIPFFQQINVVVAALAVLMLAVPIHEALTVIPYMRALRLGRDDRRKAKEQLAIEKARQLAEMQAAQLQLEAQHRQRMPTAAKTASPQAVPPSPRLVAQAEMELMGLLNAIKEDTLPPNMTQEEVAMGIYQRLLFLGIDPENVFGPDEEQSTEEGELPDSTRRLSVAPAHEMARRTSLDGGPRLLSPKERRASVQRLSLIAGSTAMLNDENVAALAGAFIAEEIAHRSEMSLMAGTAPGAYHDEDASDQSQSEGTTPREEPSETDPLLYGSASQAEAGKGSAAASRLLSVIQIPKPEGHSSAAPINFGSGPNSEA